jgi:peptidoglycan/xylan/chitin deacetylase (PgdA/CDA1 family)
MVDRMVGHLVRLGGDVSATLRNQTVRTFAYHSISNDRLDPLAVTPMVFHAQMELIARMGIPVLPASRLIEALEAKRTLRLSVCITFDDAFQDFRENALPVLRKFGFPSTLFISTALVGTVGHWRTWEEERAFLDWEDLRSLGNDVEIGSHAVEHCRLPALSSESLVRELVEARASLNGHHLLSLNAIAYPYGAHDRRVRAAAASAGYRAGFACDGPWGNHVGTDRFALRRTVVQSDTTIKDIRDHIRSRNLL